jgi:hypothetical protein
VTAEAGPEGADVARRGGGGRGDKRVEVVVCASRPPTCENGFSGAPAQSGTGQILLGVLRQDGARLPAALARRRGIMVLIGATKRGFARVQLFQGRARKAKATKRLRLRLRVPGPARVVLRSAALTKGPTGSRSAPTAAPSCGARRSSPRPPDRAGDAPATVMDTGREDIIAGGEAFLERGDGPGSPPRSPWRAPRPWPRDARSSRASAS